MSNLPKCVTREYNKKGQAVGTQLPNAKVGGIFTKDK